MVRFRSKIIRYGIEVPVEVIYRYTGSQYAPSGYQLVRVVDGHGNRIELSGEEETELIIAANSFHMGRIYRQCQISYKVSYASK